MLIKVFIILTTNFAANSRDEPLVKFTSVKCTSTKSIISKCFVKAYSRKNTTLNVYLNITKEFKELNVNFMIQYRHLIPQYRTIVNVTFDFCRVRKIYLRRPAQVQSAQACADFFAGLRRHLTPQYRTIINVTFDFCHAMEFKDHPLMNWILNLWSENFRKNIHECPYKTGSMNFENLYILVHRLVSRFAGGSYKIILRFYNKDDSNIITVMFTLEFITIDREAF
ncbi:hypothetical protein PVAND_016878 [Polypedilum vanderplanki]|uniref:Uncharacterized protein n=2 Tax=Polypedilum vanderplanki TaxID=319348 RepID=A0A9J6BHP3_POLVA|nr:hypothetical protein PVAND_016878 [Polypedilum vanderplanki]